MISAPCGNSGGYLIVIDCSGSTDISFDSAVASKKKFFYFGRYIYKLKKFPLFIASLPIVICQLFLSISSCKVPLRKASLHLAMFMSKHLRNVLIFGFIYMAFIKSTSKIMHSLWISEIFNIRYSYKFCWNSL